MNKRRFTEFANYLEAFTLRIKERFPDSTNFINGEKKEMLERFPELSTVYAPKSQRSQTDVVEYTLKSSLNKERRKNFFGVELEMKTDTPEDCVNAINMLSKAIGSAHRDILVYSAFQGDLLCKLKDVCESSFPVILRNNIDISRSHAFFLMKFYRLVSQFPKLLQCEVPLNFFEKNFKTIENICKKDEKIWKD